MAKGRRKGSLDGLTQREQQIMNMLYKLGPSTANEIQSQINEDLSNATIRTILRILENKGHVHHSRSGNQFVFMPVEDKTTVAKGLFDSLVDVFFAGSTTDAVTTFLDKESHKLSDKELDKLSQVIEQAKNKADSK